MQDSISFSINLAYVWLVVKMACAVYFTKKELQYPTWKQGVQTPFEGADVDKNWTQVVRGIPHIIRMWMRHVAINPEWAAMKIIAWLPVGLFTGKKYLHLFLPWRVKSAPPYCSRCNDTGWYIDKYRSVSTGMSESNSCECIEELRLLSKGENSHACSVCLDKGTIGRNRPCTHCERRRKIKERLAAEDAEYDAIAKRAAEDKIERMLTAEDVAQSHAVAMQAETIVGIDQPDLPKQPKYDGVYSFPTFVCRECQVPTRQNEEGTLTHRNKCSADRPRAYMSCEGCGWSHLAGSICKHCDTDSKLMPPAERFAYLQSEKRPDLYYSGPHKDEDFRRDWFHVDVDPTEIMINDTIRVIEAPGDGHRSAWYISQGPLRVRAVNLPYIVVEYDTSHKDRRRAAKAGKYNCYSSPSRHVNVIDVRGLSLVGEKRNRTQGVGWQPLLDPKKLRRGDRFMMVSLTPSLDGDCSWRGECFEVVEGARHFSIGEQREAGGSAYLHADGSTCLKAKKLTFESLSSSLPDFKESPALFNCDQIWCCPVNDIFVEAMHCHCPDIGL